MVRSTMSLEPQEVPEGPWTFDPCTIGSGDTKSYSLSDANFDTEETNKKGGDL